MNAKQRLLQQLDELINGVPDDKQIQILYRNPVTGEVTELEVYPSKTSLSIEVDDPATAETFKKLTRHEQKD
mgnify:CR=1 FL=1